MNSRRGNGKNRPRPPDLSRDFRDIEIMSPESLYEKPALVYRCRFFQSSSHFSGFQ